MVFNSLTFMVFFVIVLGLFSLPLAWRTRKFILLVASYLFYAAWNPPFVLLLWISTVVDWVAAQKLVARPHGAAGCCCRWLLTLACWATSSTAASCWQISPLCCPQPESVTRRPYSTSCYRWESVFIPLPPCPTRWTCICAGRRPRAISSTTRCS
jgi:hypothetical protein